MKAPVYLDYAAATPVDERVLAAMQPYFSEQFYNPSATYLAAKQVAKDLQAARSSVAGQLGAKPAEVIFTAGGTEANNLAIHGIMQQYSLPGDEPRGNIVISAIEHPAVLEPAMRYDCRIVPVNKDGLIDLAALESAIDEKTVLVSIMYANNEIGAIQPLREVADVVKKKRLARLPNEKQEFKKWNLQPGQPTEPYPLHFHSDAAQASNYLDLHVSRLGVDMLTINGGKIYGPKQSGALYLAGYVRLVPQILGGGQENHARSGTENVAGSIGFATALDITQSMRHSETKRLQELQTYFFKELEAKIPNVIINGSHKKRLPNNVHITILGQDNERLLFQLDEAGILAAAGSACSASDEEPSHVLKAMGISDTNAQASLRFTMGRATTQADIDKAVAALQSFIATA